MVHLKWYMVQSNGTVFGYGWYSHWTRSVQSDVIVFGYSSHLCTELSVSIYCEFRTATNQCVDGVKQRIHLGGSSSKAHEGSRDQRCTATGSRWGQPPCKLQGEALSVLPPVELGVVPVGVGRNRACRVGSRMHVQTIG